MSFVDGHSDTLTKLFEDGGDFYENTRQIDIKRLAQYDGPVQFFGLWLSPKYYTAALPATLEIIEYYYNHLLEKNSAYLAPAFTYADIMKNKQDGKITAVLALEGLEAIGFHVSVLSTMYRLGVRLCGLTWNHSNPLATAITETKLTSGLTPLGREAVALMNTLGIIVDVSHLSEKSFWDVMETSQKPVVATHSNAHVICAHQRNLKDDQIRAIAQKGGTIGINYYADFLRAEGTATMTDVMAHIKHIIKIGGEDVVALGSDFDGIDRYPEELADVAGQAALLDVVEKELGSGVREKLAETNMLRVIKEVWS